MLPLRRTIFLRYSTIQYFHFPCLSQEEVTRGGTLLHMQLMASTLRIYNGEYPWLVQSREIVKSRKKPVKIKKTHKILDNYTDYWIVDN